MKYFLYDKLKLKLSYLIIKLNLIYLCFFFDFLGVIIKKNILYYLIKISFKK